MVRQFLKMSKLIFVYNADAGAMNTALDIAHKVLSPDTYSCNLCMLTHDTFTERSAWKSFRESHAMQMEFLHKDEYEQRYDRFSRSIGAEKRHESYPVILKEDHGNIDMFLDTAAINRIQDVSTLIATIQAGLSKRN